jgi:hypothetical protein
VEFLAAILAKYCAGDLRRRRKVELAMLPYGGLQMNLLEGVNKLDNEFNILSFTHADSLWAKLDGMPFDEEGMQQRWEWCDDLYRRLMKCLEREFPKLEKGERQIICDFRMYPIREHVERTEAEFGCYREVRSALLGSDLLLEMLCIPPVPHS